MCDATLEDLVSKEFRILFLDDDQMIRTLFTSFFSAFQTSRTADLQQDNGDTPHTYDLTCKSSGEEGVEAVRRSLSEQAPYSVAFIDINMPPGIDGITTAAAIREIDQDIEIVIVTGDMVVDLNHIHNTVHPLHKLLLLSKPFTRIEIQQAVLSLSEKWAALRQNRKLLKRLETAVDITSQEIVKTRDNYREIFENATEIILSISMDGMLLLVNPMWEKLIGYTNTHAHRISLYDYIEQSRKAEFRSLVEHAASLSSDINVETVFLAKSGKKIFVEGSIVPRIRKGRTIGLSMFFRNVSKRKEMETALHITTDNLRKIFPGVIKTLASTVEIRDPYTAGHQVRVANLCHAIAEELNIDASIIEGLYIAGLLHDIGKISIPADILSKPGKLQAAEYQLIQQHVDIGYNLLKNIEFPWPVAEYVQQHHERNDGTGYPMRLRRDEISLESKILIVADVVEAISSHRPYRPALGIEEALNVITKGKGQLFEDSVVDACLTVFTQRDFSFSDDHSYW